MNKNILFLTSRTALVFAFMALAIGCKDDTVNDIETTEGDVQTLYQDKVDYMNNDARIISALVQGGLEVKTTWTDERTKNTSMLFSNDLVATVYDAANYTKMRTIPLPGIDADGNWICDYFGEVSPLLDGKGNTVSAKGGTAPEMRLNVTGYWEYSRRSER